ncbi:MAG TPA: hypothetical protein VNK70_01565 [Candidatus Paceibacterota bacterium]|nr:hypothetical protein [Candidatus Paceibacterota bacterium]
MDILQSAIDVVRDFPWFRTFNAVRWVFIFLDFALVVIFVYAFAKGLKYRPKFYFRPDELAKKKQIIKDRKWQVHWSHILEKSRRTPPQSLFMAIIEADGLVDTVLKKIGIPGEHMADRLERLANRNLNTIDRLWRAHRVRNDLAHTPGFTLDPRDAEQILVDYEEFLKEIGAI